MADEDKVYSALAIRDTNTHNSTESLSGETEPATIAIENGLNQTVTLQLQGTYCTATNWVNIGSSFNVNSTTDTYKNITDYFSKYRLTASCTTAPTSGTLSAWILKKGR